MYVCMLRDISMPLHRRKEKDEEMSIERKVSKLSLSLFLFLSI